MLLSAFVVAKALPYHLFCQAVLVGADKEREVSLFPVGSKGVAPIKRLHGSKLECTISEYSKQTITFALVSAPLSHVSLWHDLISGHTQVQKPGSAVDHIALTAL